MKKILKYVSAAMLVLSSLFASVSCEKEPEMTEAKNALIELIREAEELQASRVEGLDEGQQAAGSKRAFQATIDRAYFILNTATNDEAFTNAYNNLLKDIEAFKLNVIKAGIPSFSQGSYIKCGNDESLKFADGFTISARVRFNDLSAQNYVFATEGAKQGFMCRTNAEGKIQFVLYNGGWMGSAKWAVTKMEKDKWYVITAVYKAPESGAQGYAYLYINGKKEVEITGLGKALVKSEHDFHFGTPAAYSGRPLKGDVQHITIWDDVRTPDEITADMDFGFKGDEEGLIAYWPLLVNVGTEILDVTGNHTAKLSSITWKDKEE